MKPSVLAFLGHLCRAGAWLGTQVSCGGKLKGFSQGILPETHWGLNILEVHPNCLD
jgi:hypothetical protein